MKARPHDLLLFASNFVKHPKMLGSVIPSSRFLVNRLLREVDWSRAQVVLEYGPGVGTITREALRRMPPDGLLIVFETNRDFVRFLRRRFDDPRLHVVHGSAASAATALRERGVSQADYVISGIPYTTLPPDVRDQILQTTGAVLRPNGAFLVYQFTRAVLPSLLEVFGTVRQEFEPRNVMPARLFYCRPGPDLGEAVVTPSSAPASARDRQADSTIRLTSPRTSSRAGSPSDRR